MSEEIKEILEDVKRHIDYVNATNQKSIRDNEMESMYFEIERLNNIINELEKYHKIQMGIASDVRDNQYCLGRYDSSYDSFQKIQELKGSDSNE